MPMREEAMIDEEAMTINEVMIDDKWGSDSWRWWETHERRRNTCMAKPWRLWKMKWTENFGECGGEKCGRVFIGRRRIVTSRLSFAGATAVFLQILRISADGTFKNCRILLGKERGVVGRWCWRLMKEGAAFALLVREGTEGGMLMVTTVPGGVNLFGRISIFTPQLTRRRKTRLSKDMRVVGDHRWVFVPLNGASPRFNFEPRREKPFDIDRQDAFIAH
jgi:hypothetical protein